MGPLIFWKKPYGIQWEDKDSGLGVHTKGPWFRSQREGPWICSAGFRRGLFYGPLVGYVPYNWCVSGSRLGVRAQGPMLWTVEAK